MVDENKKRVGGFPRKKPGPTPKPDDAKTDRLMMRIHPDLMEVLSERARERGINRSQYIEKILIGWVNLDPRNMQLDQIGKRSATAPSPTEVRKRSALDFTDRWRKFCSASALLLGFEPPKIWFDEWEYNSGFGDYGPEPDNEGEGQVPARWRKKK